MTKFSAELDTKKWETHERECQAAAMAALKERIKPFNRQKMARNPKRKPASEASITDRATPARQGEPR